MFTNKRFRRNLAQGFFLERFGSAKAYKIFVCMAVNDASTCKICRGMVANGAKPCIICW